MQKLQDTILYNLPFLKKYGDEYLFNTCYEIDEQLTTLSISLPFEPENGIRAIYFIFENPQQFIGRLEINEDGLIYEDVQDDKYYQIIEPYEKISVCNFDVFVKNNMFMYSFIPYPEDQLSIPSKRQSVSLKITFKNPKKNRMLAIIQINK